MCLAGRWLRCLWIMGNAAIVRRDSTQRAFAYGDSTRRWWVSKSVAPPIEWSPLGVRVHGAAAAMLASDYTARSKAIKFIDLSCICG